MVWLRTSAEVVIRSSGWVSLPVAPFLSITCFRSRSWIFSLDMAPLHGPRRSLCSITLVPAFPSAETSVLLSDWTRSLAGVVGPPKKESSWLSSRLMGASAACRFIFLYHWPSLPDPQKKSAWSYSVLRVGAWAASRFRHRVDHRLALSDLQWKRKKNRRNFLRQTLCPWACLDCTMGKKGSLWLGTHWWNLHR